MPDNFAGQTVGGCRGDDWGCSGQPRGKIAGVEAVTAAVVSTGTTSCGTGTCSCASAEATIALLGPFFTTISPIANARIRSTVASGLGSPHNTASSS